MSVKPKGLLGNIKIARFSPSSASLKYEFQSLNLHSIYQGNLLNYLPPNPVRYPYELKYFMCNGGVETARARKS